MGFDGRSERASDVEGLLKRSMARYNLCIRRGHSTLSWSGHGYEIGKQARLDGRR